MNIATKLVIFNLRILGLDPNIQNRTTRCLNILAIVVTILILLPYLIEVVFYFDGIEIIDKCFYAVVPIQILGIIYTFIRKRQIIRNLLNANQLSYIHQLDPDLENRISAMRKRELLFVLTIYLILILILAMTIVPCLKEDKWLYLGYRHCKTPLCYKLQFLLQMLMACFVSLPTYFTYFSLFWLSLTKSLCYLEMLRYSIKNIMPDNLRKDLRELVGQHVNILRFIGSIDSLYRSTLLVLFVIYPLYIIFGLFLITQEGMPPSMSTTMKFVPDMSISLLILFFFCAAGEVIKNKFESVSNAVYNINWLHSEAKRNRLGKDMVLVLQMTQHCPDITIYSLQPLNLKVFLQVLQFSYSVYTFLVATQK